MAKWVWVSRWSVQATRVEIWRVNSQSLHRVKDKRRSTTMQSSFFVVPEENNIKKKIKSSVGRNSSCGDIGGGISLR